MSGATSSKKVAELTIHRYKPSQIVKMIHALIKANRPMFLWGEPAIGKSAVTRAVADALGIALADVRLSQVDPTDLRGMPYPVIENGVHYLAWSPPSVLPQDLDLLVERTTAFPVSMFVKFPVGNPLGSNDIHYITKIDYEAEPHDPNTVCEIIDTGPTHVEVAIFAKGEDGLRTGPKIAGGATIRIRGKARALVAFEEFNSAAQAVQAASYQLVLDRRLGQYVVPEGCWQMALGNTENVGGITFKLGWPLRSRFVHAEMTPDFEEWYEHAVATGHHPAVVSYLDAFKDQLFVFDNKSKSMNFQAPRTWSIVSDILNSNDYLEEDIALGLFIGAVGDGAAYQFAEHRKIADQLPKSGAILSGAVTKLEETPNIALSFALTTTLCYELKQRADEIKRESNWKMSPERKEWLQQADNFLLFVQKNFSPEIAIMGVRRAVQTHKLPFETNKMKNFDVFVNRFKDLIV